MILYKVTEQQEYTEEGEVKRREFENIAPRLAGIGVGVCAEGDKACKRRDKRARTADIYAEKQLAVVIGKLREQYRRGDVAYDLTG